jgi:hypothetical protein
MKPWFGVLGRACLECLILLVFVSLVAGASTSLAAETTTVRDLMCHALWAARGFLPVVAVATIFLSFFAFERRLRSRLLGWFGALVLGAFLFSGGIALRRLPIVDRLAPDVAPAARPLQAAGEGVKRLSVLLWYRSAGSADLEDVVVADFGAPFPRVAYARRAPLRGGAVELGGKLFDAGMPRPVADDLLPETRFFAGSWIWERLAGMDGSPLFLTAVISAGFILLAAGFRFIARLTRWPLANAFFALAGFVGLLVLDAALASPTASSFIASLAGPLAGRVGLAGQFATPAFLIAIAEGLVGILLAAADLAIAPSERESRG